MLCQYCGRNPAVIHVKTIADGGLSECSLCSECARELGYCNLLSGLGPDFNAILRDFFSQSEEPDETRCKCCGATFSEIARSGKVGCPECYTTFYDRLLPIVQQIHGNVSHRGKVPGAGLPQVKQSGSLSLMRQKLREAIDSENFEQAAVLRDSIRELEKGEEP